MSNRKGAVMWQILYGHNVMLNDVRQQLKLLHQKIDSIPHKEIICRNAFQSVARQVTLRKKQLEAVVTEDEGQVIEVQIEK